jgi:chloramphenicol 3-O-phosphotransferase
MRMVFLHGPPAAGKLTVGRALQELTDFRLFHNHLVVDTLLSVFPFGTEPFVRLREEIWLSVFREAAKEGISLIFTFAPESTVNPGFIDRAVDIVNGAGGKIHFVELTCPVEELERRIEDPSRAQFLKLRSVEMFRKIRQSNARKFPSLPSSGLVIDTSRNDPVGSARAICESFGLNITL